VAAALAPTVGLSWRRCLNDFNLDPPWTTNPPWSIKPASRTCTRSTTSLVQIARAEMDSLYEQISGSGYALLLADTSGVILCEKIDPTLKRMFVQAGLVVGAQWSDSAKGPTASARVPPSRAPSRSINQITSARDTLASPVPRRHSRPYGAS